VADEEGFEEIAKVLGDSQVEMEHEKTLLKLLKNVETGQVFKKLLSSSGAAGTAATCMREPRLLTFARRAPPQAHYELLAENY
jgi:rubrerythrin